MAFLALVGVAVWTEPRFLDKGWSDCGNLRSSLLCSTDTDLFRFELFWIRFKCECCWSTIMAAEFFREPMPAPRLPPVVLRPPKAFGADCCEDW